MSARATPAPRENPELLGHGAAERALLAAWGSGRMPHAWLIAGPRGIGKATLAYRFARFVLAGGGGGGLFAGAPDTLAVPAEDAVFRRVASGGHADLLTLEPGMIHPETRKPTEEIVVGHVRRAVEFLTRTAAEGGWRVVVIDGAEAMNANAANALLKILEEPSANALLLLASHSPGRLLPTIRSRCRMLALEPLADEHVAALLARFRPELAAAERAVLVRLGAGSIGRALDLADHGGAALHGEVAALLGALPALDVPALHAFAERLARGGDEAPAGFRTAMELIAGWLAETIKREPGAARGERWLAAWDEVRRLAGAAEGLNLDRKQALLGAVLAVQRAAAWIAGSSPAMAVQGDGASHL